MSRRSVPHFTAPLLICMLLASGVAPPTLAASRPGVSAASVMAVTPDAQASEIAAEVMRNGGNAVDGAVAAALALAVALPYAGNLGGGGFLLYRAAEGEYHALDFRETAPAALKSADFLDEDGRPVPGLSLESGLAVGVPGTVAGLYEAHRRWGKLDWVEVVLPALNLANDGSEISPWLASVFEARSEFLSRNEAAWESYTIDGRVPRAGERLRQLHLARALRRIAEAGRDGFYTGPTAEAIVASVNAQGGVMTLEDLANYQVQIREPISGSYRGQRVISFPPPSSGGVILLQMLGMLERYPISKWGPLASRTVHLMAEIERRAYADRSRWLGDPNFFAVPTTGLLKPSYIKSRMRDFSPKRATPSAKTFPGEQWIAESDETLHLSVVDATGAAVSLTTTLNAAFGSGIVAAGTGILLNGQIDDFALAPGIPNQWGLLGSEANQVEGGKRPLSSMTPTIVECAEPGPRPCLVLGSPGGSRIITSVFQVVTNVVDHSMPLQAAVDQPRFHHQWLPDRLDHEAWAFPEDVRLALEKRGHTLHQPTGTFGNVSAIGLDDAGRWIGAADPRRQGAARGF
jgi:gamma-glutamyltranspeptidase/glutathione hydrolase